MTTPKATEADWVDAIAQRAELPITDVEAVLARHGIKAQATLPRRRSLAFRSVTLKGVKEGTGDDGPFDQTWTFGPGLWAILSDRNSRGKSSVLNIMQGGIRGDFPKRIKADVWRWLSHVEVQFEVNAIAYRVLVQKPACDDSPDAAASSFCRFEHGTWLTIHQGPLSKLQPTAEAVLMEELSFAKFHAFNNKTGGQHTHSWNAIASALFVTGPGSAVFGDEVLDAMPLRLLQMFMGLPWISTYSAATTALKQVQAVAKANGGAQDPTRLRFEARLGSLEEQLDVARGRVRPGGERSTLRLDLSQRDNAVVDLRRRVSNARDELATLEHRFVGAKSVLAATRRALQQVRDERAAGIVFRQLKPLCCPSCDTGIDGAKYEAAQAADTCALCGTRHTEPDGEETLRLEELVIDVTDAEAAVARVAAEVDAATARQRAAEDEIAVEMHAIRAIEAELASEWETELELEVRGLEAQAQQLREFLAEAPAKPNGVAGADDEGVLTAAVAVTKELFDGLARDILVDVSREITRLSQRFGVENVESMDFDTGGRLKITQGGTTTSFTKLSPGENLRVRIAAALAVIEVSRQRHFGRHPGLLVLDSPAAQEMTGDDFAALLASVQEAIAQTDDIQIIVGAVARPELLGVVPREHTSHAEGESFLF